MDSQQPMFSNNSNDAQFRRTASPLASLEDDGEALIDSSKLHSSSPNLLSQRLRAVRPEIINCLSFMNVCSKLYYNPTTSLIRIPFLLAGFIIIGIDMYFIYCQWMLQMRHAIPTMCRAIFSRRGGKTINVVDALDDLMSDLPQTIWVVIYLFNFDFSIIALICAMHSSFSVLEGVARLRSGE